MFCQKQTNHTNSFPSGYGGQTHKFPMYVIYELLLAEIPIPNPE
jgi:hypothetical protein